ELVGVGAGGGAELDEALEALDEAVERRTIQRFEHGGLDYRDFLFAGELALDGRLRPVKGVIAMASLAAKLGLRGVIVPAENADEASVTPGVETYGVRTLSEVVGLLTGSLAAEPMPPVD